MSEIFDAYCDDLKFLATDLKNNLEVLRSGENFESARKTIQAVLDQSTDLVKQVEVEVRGHSSQERRILTEKLKIYKDEFFQLKQEFDSVVFQSQKSQLVGKSGEDRGRMLETNEKMRRQNEIIENCKRTVAETEEIGIETIAELQNNREKIESARAKGQEFHAVADDADKRLKSMWFRHKTWGLFG
uniref:Vesicle transport v-SNARE N-terminal domain-containing protein n=1 Tax=Spumella elongata TaxID=89044 RepID=A0A7S3M5W9_9STRA|mmetsp:Transcript_3141/g.5221  ORF Transcript_3141/g.5221 Transcript_3141/m.5221 type:complete len:187 (+) Transcript_3141:52-612(+)